jgi:hypothetical protein
MFFLFAFSIDLTRLYSTMIYWSGLGAFVSVFELNGALHEGCSLGLGFGTIVHLPGSWNMMTGSDRFAHTHTHIMKHNNSPSNNPIIACLFTSFTSETKTSFISTQTLLQTHEQTDSKRCRLDDFWQDLVIIFLQSAAHLHEDVCLDF